MNGTLRQIPLSEIRDHVGTPPTTRFRKSVRRMGVVQPVLLSESTHETGELRYEIIDGNRRISAARSVRMKTIPAIVLTGLTTDQIAQLTLVLNGYRSANYLTEFWAIKSLGRSNYSTDEIQQLAGFSDSMMVHRESFAGLNREIFVAMRNGKITQLNASAIAKLSRADQQILAEKFRKRGRLAKWEINEVARSRQQTIKPMYVQPASTGPVIPIQFVTPGSITPPATWDRFESTTTVSTGNVDAPSISVPEASLSADVDKELEAHEVEKPEAEETPAIHNSSEVSADSVTPSKSISISLSVDDQVATLRFLREQLIAAANTAEQLGMDRLQFLTHASKIWDRRSESLQKQLEFKRGPSESPRSTSMAVEISPMQQGLNRDGRLTSAD